MHCSDQSQSTHERRPVRLLVANQCQPATATAATAAAAPAERTERRQAGEQGQAECESTGGRQCRFAVDVQSVRI